MAQSSSRRKDFPLEELMNVSQSRKSFLASLVKRMKWCECLMPIVRLISLRRETLPGVTTEHAKFNKPIRDWSSFSVTFFLPSKLWIANRHFSTFSWGSLTLSYYNLIQFLQTLKPEKDPQFFSGAIGTPTFSQNAKNYWRLVLHASKDSAAIKKSSRMWIICGMLSLLRATHFKAVLSFSNVLHELASPIGKQQSA